jgi:hypothetical protein
MNGGSQMKASKKEFFLAANQMELPAEVGLVRRLESTRPAPAWASNGASEGTLCLPYTTTDTILQTSSIAKQGEQESERPR